MVRCRPILRLIRSESVLRSRPEVLDALGTALLDGLIIRLVREFFTTLELNTSLQRATSHCGLNGVLKHTQSPMTRTAPLDYRANQLIRTRLSQLLSLWLAEVTWRSPVTTLWAGECQQFRLRLPIRTQFLLIPSSMPSGEPPIIR